MVRKKKVKFKIDKHVLSPKHQKASEKEKKQVLDQYNVTEKELPKIAKSDAAIQALDVKSGDVIKITRESPTRGQSIFYRVVIDV